MRCKKKWLFTVDRKMAQSRYLVYVAYIVIISIISQPYTTSIATKDDYVTYGNSFYFWYTYILFVIISELILSIFSETFKPGCYEIIRSFSVPIFELVWKRFVKAIIIIFVPYIPSVIFGVQKINKSIYQTTCATYVYSGYICPKIDWRIVLFHCIITSIFCATITLFMLIVIRNHKTVMMIVLSYCAMEAGPFPATLGKYTLFNGAFNTPNFYEWFPPHLMIQITIIVFCVVAISFLLKKEWNCQDNCSRKIP